jgi:hypothetical protein
MVSLHFLQNITGIQKLFRKYYIKDVSTRDICVIELNVKTNQLYRAQNHGILIENVLDPSSESPVVSSPPCCHKCNI